MVIQQTPGRRIFFLRPGFFSILSAFAALTIVSASFLSFTGQNIRTGNEEQGQTSTSPPNNDVARPRQPNVILIITDDQGYGDFSAHGNPILKTPALDRLHAQSVRFTDYHSSPMCSPTRGQLMTGRDAVDNGCTAVCLGRSMVREELPTMADIFKTSGYRTAHFGKWHMGDSYPYRPQDRGFETTIHHGAWGIGSIPDYYQNSYWKGSFRQQDSSLKKYDKYCTDEWFDYTIDYIRNSQKQEKPFFLYLATNCPHWPHLVDEKYSDPYRKQGLSVDVANFFGQVANIDENMDRLLGALDETGLSENTILIYTTDNGTVKGDSVFNAGMRGAKTTPYEGGHRVPFFLRWPGLKTPQPRDIDELVQVQDVLPTLIDLCGLKSPTNAGFDGISLAPLLNGSKKALDDRILVVEYDNPYRPKENKAVLWKNWRLVMNEELYDLSTDPGQQKNLASSRPDIMKKLQQYYLKWKEDALKGYEKPRYIHVGAPRQHSVMLYSPDWKGMYADTRYDLLAGNRTGSWAINVDRPGRYEITLYRWHPASGLPLTSHDPNPPPNNKTDGAIPIAQAQLRIGDFDKTVQTDAGQHSVTFTVNLKKGPGNLETKFLDNKGTALCSAYYTSVKFIQ